MYHPVPGNIMTDEQTTKPETYNCGQVSHCRLIGFILGRQ